MSNKLEIMENEERGCDMFMSQPLLIWSTFS